MLVTSLFFSSLTVILALKSGDQMTGILYYLIGKDDIYIKKVHKHMFYITSNNKGSTHETLSKTNNIFIASYQLVCTSGVNLV